MKTSGCNLLIHCVCELDPNGQSAYSYCILEYRRKRPAAVALVRLEEEGGLAPTAAGLGRRSATPPAPGVTASVLSASAASPARAHLQHAPLPSIHHRWTDNPAQIIHRLHQRVIPPDNDPCVLCVMSAILVVPPALRSSSVRPCCSKPGRRIQKGSVGRPEDSGGNGPAHTALPQQQHTAEPGSSA